MRFYKPQQQQIGLCHGQSQGASTAGHGAGKLSAVAPRVREPCRQPSTGIQQELCRQPSTGIQGTCSALHSNLVPCTSASPSPRVLQELWPGDCKRKQNPATWQSTCQISQSASGEWKETPLQRRFSFNIFMDCQCHK